MAALLWPNGTGSLPATQVSSEYGMRWHPLDGVWRLHGGIDLIRFSTVCSPVDGIVKMAAYSGGYGNLVQIRAYGPNAFKPGDEHWLAHNKSFLVSKGDTVTAGRGVAIMGTTGASTGVHCHYETRPNGGSTVNPRHYFSTASGGGSNPFPTPTPPPAVKLGDEEMRVVLWKETGTLLAFAPGQVRVFGAGELTAAARVRDITGRDEASPSKFYETDNIGIGGLCESYGVPFNEGVMAAMNGDAWQITGATPGNFWSRDFL